MRARALVEDGLTEYHVEHVVPVGCHEQQEAIVSAADVANLGAVVMPGVSHGMRSGW